MEIKTKYNIGDHVYFMHNNAVNTGYIDRIKIKVYNLCNSGLYTRIYYKVKDMNLTLGEEVCFETKEELIATL